MPMGVPLPPEGDTSWYDWATAAHALLNALNTMSAANAADYALLASPTFTGNVIVPAADSAGEPIVYNQAGARLNGLLVLPVPGRRRTPVPARTSPTWSA